MWLFPHHFTPPGEAHGARATAVSQKPSQGLSQAAAQEHELLLNEPELSSLLEPRGVLQGLTAQVVHLLSQKRVLPGDRVRFISSLASGFLLTETTLPPPSWLGELLPIEDVSLAGCVPIRPRPFLPSDLPWTRSTRPEAADVGSPTWSWSPLTVRGVGPRCLVLGPESTTRFSVHVHGMNTRREEGGPPTA